MSKGAADSNGHEQKIECYDLVPWSSRSVVVERCVYRLVVAKLE